MEYSAARVHKQTITSLWKKRYDKATQAKNATLILALEKEKEDLRLDEGV